MKLSGVKSTNKKMHSIADAFGNLIVDGFHFIALFAIVVTIIISAVLAFSEMIANQAISIEDILLLFIYLELGVMVGIYFKTNHMPIRFLLYVAITALTRMIVGEIQVNDEPNIPILYASAAILLLAISNFIIRFASNRYPSEQERAIKRRA
jgi:phosphate starvation-inducible membrane PsiE